MRSATVAEALGDLACDHRAAALVFDSGIELTRLSSEEQTALAATLATLRAAQAAPDGGLTMIPDAPRNGHREQSS